MDTKTCTQCGVEKPLSEFYKHRRIKSGYRGECKSCIKVYRENNALKIKEYEKNRSDLPHRIKARKEYVSSERGKEVIKSLTKKHRNKNPVKYKARTALNNAIRDGRVMKLDYCENCGQTEKRVLGHHNDYSKPLEVTWLCDKCHIQWHKENGEGLNGT